MGGLRLGWRLGGFGWRLGAIRMKGKAWVCSLLLGGLGFGLWVGKFFLYTLKGNLNGFWFQDILLFELLIVKSIKST